MRVLYVYPHPDDESFGPGPALAKNAREGHDVHLLTLTRGGATKQRHKYGHSIEEMGAVREAEMRQVAKVLGLKTLEVLDLPDSGLKEIDPRMIEKAVGEAFEAHRPEVVVTYPVHGVSGFHDHLVSHAVVKRVFLEHRERFDYPRRLAFSTIGEDMAVASTAFPLSFSTPEEIDCIVRASSDDLEAGRLALDCYVTFQETIRRTGIRDTLSRDVPFEFFRETFAPPVDDLFANLP